MNKWEGWMGGQIDGWMDEWIYEEMMDRWTDGKMNG